MVAKTVLVVENDPTLRIVAEEMFVAAGFEVESVQRADHALDIVAQRSDHLDEALSQFDRSCDDFEMGRL